MEHYLFVSSKDTDLPGNHPSDFTVTLPKTYHLKGQWACALLEISLHLPFHQRVHVCCDVIEDSYIRGSLFPLLRIIPAMQDDVGRIGDDTVYGHLTFERPYFFPLRKKDLDRLRISIRGSELQPLTFDKPVHCVLLLKKQPWDQ